MKTIVFVQARMNSTRLPGKMMMDLGGEPVVAWSLQRARRATLVHEVWLATTNDNSDNPLAEWAIRNNFLVYRGSENDVLDRYYQAAKKAGADTIIRVTGDCPFVDPAIIDEMVAYFYEQKNCVYGSNIHPPTFPDGLDVEIFSMTALEKAWTEAKLASEREHVTPYIWKHPELFSPCVLQNTENISAERWTLDVPEDLEFLRTLVSSFGESIKIAPYQDILAFIQKNPQYRTINAHFERNEGYTKSVNEDKI